MDRRKKDAPSSGAAGPLPTRHPGVAAPRRARRAALPWPWPRHPLTLPLPTRYPAAAAPHKADAPVCRGRGRDTRPPRCCSPAAAYTATFHPAAVNGSMLIG